jgi:para-aminobenzoate synthetase component I
MNSIVPESTPLHRVVRVHELPAPLQLFPLVPLFDDQPYLALLDNPTEPSKLARYSFLATDPFLVFQSKRARCSAGPPGRLRDLAGDPLSELRRLFARYRLPGPSAPDLPPFLGGAVGYLGYELLYLIEQIPDRGLDVRPVPDSQLLFCRTVIATDSVAGRTWLVSNGFGETVAEAEREADAGLRGLQARLTARPSEERVEARRRELQQRRLERQQTQLHLSEQDVFERRIRPVVSREQYLRMVEAAKSHIFAGDTFEICLTQKFDSQFTGRGVDLYEVLRAVNAAPFASYLRFPSVEVISSSIERFMRLDRSGWVETRPIKGTRRRSISSSAADALVRAELESCEKDRAENIMIVDLARNDLGRVCEFGTVRVPELRIVESYAFVHQMVSTVRGRLRADCDTIDLLRASFPGGSMTGAPKVESMKIIDALEPVKRGIFSGSIGYFDFDGSFDLNIVIRTLIKKGDAIDFHVGGAIVADSDPADEYQETLDKAFGLVTALDFARRGAKP